MNGCSLPTLSHRSNLISFTICTLAIGLLSTVTTPLTWAISEAAPATGPSTAPSTETNAGSVRQWALATQLVIPSLTGLASQSDGSTSIDISPNWLLGVVFERSTWNIELLGSPLGTGGMPGVYSKQTFLLKSQYLIPIWSFKAELGGGLWLDWISGNGGTERLNNANSTSTYAHPGRNAIDLQLFLAAGVRMPPWVRHLDFELQSYLRTIFSSRRDMGIALEARYAFF